MRPTVSYETAADVLRRDVRALVAVRDAARLRRAVGETVAVHEVAQAADGATYLHVLTNGGGAEQGGPVGVGIGPFVVTLSAVGLGATSADEIVILPGRHSGSAVIENGSSEPHTVAVRIGLQPGTTSLLPPGRRWRIDVP